MAMSIKEALPTMLALAHENTELSRIQLAGMLADVFLSEDSQKLVLREEEQLNELINVLMTSSSAQVRSHLIKKFVDVSKMPRRIATDLVQNDIDVARPILVASTTLTDDDLIHVVEAKGSDHALAVAERREVSEAVADALVTTGDIRVMQVVVENLGACLSPIAVDALAESARFAVDLRKPLLSRPEIKVDNALKLYWWVEQDLRRYALSRFGITSGQVDDALAKTIGAFLDEHDKERTNDEVMKQIAEWIEEHQALSAKILPQVLRMGHFRLFNMLLARLAGLPLSLIDTIMEEVGGRGLASVCRAVGVEKAGFVSLFLLSRGGRPGEQIVHPRELSYALEAFDRMTVEVARDLLHTWSVDPSYFVKHRASDVGLDRIQAQI